LGLVTASEKRPFKDAKTKSLIAKAVGLFVLLG
jgi:hypothetical protein